MNKNNYKRIEIGSLVGKTIETILVRDPAFNQSRDVEVEPGKWDIRFVLSGGKEYALAHLQDCCESVNLEDVEGEFNWLIGNPILSANDDEVFAWGIYRNVSNGDYYFSVKGSVVMVTDANYFDSEGYCSDWHLGHLVNMPDGIDDESQEATFLSVTQPEKLNVK